MIVSFYPSCCFPGASSNGPLTAFINDSLRSHVRVSIHPYMYLSRPDCIPRKTLCRYIMLSQIQFVISFLFLSAFFLPFFVLRAKLTSQRTVRDAIFATQRRFDKQVLSHRHFSPITDCLFECHNAHNIRNHNTLATIRFHPLLSSLLPAQDYYITCFLI